MRALMGIAIKKKPPRIHQMLQLVDAEVVLLEGLLEALDELELLDDTRPAELEELELLELEELELEELELLERHPRSAPFLFLHALLSGSAQFTSICKKVPHGHGGTEAPLGDTGVFGTMVSQVVFPGVTETCPDIWPPATTPIIVNVTLVQP
jgi:hypothetical protein